MEKLVGIGDFFFRAEDPVALGAWYHDHLGIDLVPGDYDHPPWRQQAGPTVFAPFARDTDHFGDSRKEWMINFRVRDLDAIVAQLRAAGVAVAVDAEQYPNGRFARLADPEANPIELWQPEGGDAGRA